MFFKLFQNSQKIMRNIEIKAKVNNLPKLLEYIKALSDTKQIEIKQDDTFFNAQHGRLKLRKFEHGDGELIFYDRPNQEGPKLSSYEKCIIATDSLPKLSEVLTKALGVCGSVKKTRLLFIIGQTRVHIDCVEGLGNFVELEVVLSEDDAPEMGEKIAEDLMKKLGVEKVDLLSCAYTDLIKNK